MNLQFDLTSRMASHSALRLSSESLNCGSVCPTEDCITEGQAMQTCWNRTRPVFVEYAGVWWYLAEETPLHLGRDSLGAVRTKLNYED
jgi:hypothetical protein